MSNWNTCQKSKTGLSVGQTQLYHWIIKAFVNTADKRKTFLTGMVLMMKAYTTGFVIQLSIFPTNSFVTICCIESGLSVKRDDIDLLFLGLVWQCVIWNGGLVPKSNETQFSMLSSEELSESEHVLS